MTPAHVITLTCPHCGAAVDLDREPLTDGVDCPACARPFESTAYRFCPLCAGTLARMDDGERRRLACESCGFIFYRNPLPGVAAVVTDEDRILLVQRRSSVFDGMWCAPCGYVEVDEDVREAARRECFEETGLDVTAGDVIWVRSSFQVAYRPVVGVWFRCRVAGGALAPGAGVRDARFFPLDATPPDLAFEGDRIVIDLLRRERSTA